jgi:aryl-alcohol dehydrogenase-like predicted oxidoreductase
MRYRPLGARGQVVSAVSLVLEPDSSRRNAGDWISLIYAALECGVCGFEIRSLDKALCEALAHAFTNVDRRLGFIVLRLDDRRGSASLAEVGPQIKDVLVRTRIGYLDAVLLHEPMGPSPPALRELSALKTAGVVRFLGVAGHGPQVDALVEEGRLDILSTGYSLLSGWAERRRIREAMASDMGVLGFDAYPREQLEPLLGRRPQHRRDPLSGMGGYGFLEATREWSPEELCMAYALTEPALATVLVRPRSIEHLERLAAVADRDLPSGVSAQIEMARFSALGEEGARRSA